jgi:hypothetical protein
MPEPSRLRCWQCHRLGDGLHLGGLPDDAVGLGLFGDAVSLRQIFIEGRPSGLIPYASLAGDDRATVCSERARPAWGRGVFWGRPRLGRPARGNPQRQQPGSRQVPAIVAQRVL